MANSLFKKIKIFTSTSSGGGAAAGTVWKLDGNTEGSEKYFGTNDNYSIPIYTNGIARGIIGNNGDFAFGSSTLLANTRMYIKGINSVSTDNALVVANSSGNIAVFRNDGAVGVGGTSIYSNYKLQILTSVTNDGVQIIGSGVGTALLQTDTDALSGNLKLWSQGLGAYGISLSGMSNSYINTGFNVGIGTTSPTSALHIEKATSGYLLNLKNLDATLITRFKLTNNSEDTTYSVNVYGNSSASPNRISISTGHGKDLDYDLGSSPAGTFRIARGDGYTTPIFFVNGVNLNVGIGTSTPTSKLSVVDGVSTANFGGGFPSIYKDATNYLQFNQSNLGITQLTASSLISLTYGGLSNGLHISQTNYSVGNLLSYNVGDYMFRSYKDNNTNKFIVNHFGFSGDNKLGVSVDPTATIHAKGVDSTSSNFTLKLDNSASSPLLYVRNDTRVGIGIASPAYDLDVTKNVGGGQFVVINSKNSSSTGASAVLASNDIGFIGMQVFGSSWSYPDTINTAILATSPTIAQMGIVTTGVSDIYFATNSGGSDNKRMIILSSGNIGIGTSTPTSKLQVVGLDSTLANFALKVDNSASSPLFYVRNDGFVGIGTNTPSSISPHVQVNSTSAFNYIQFTGTSNSRGLFINSDSDDYIDGFFKVAANSASYAGSFFEPSGKAAVIRIAQNDGVSIMDFHQYTANGKIYITSNATFTANIPNNPSIVVDGQKSGFGLVSPTAKIHAGAGTAAANTAPLKFTAGTNMTTPENGAFEFDGTNLYFTVGGVRKTVTLI